MLIRERFEKTKFSDSEQVIVDYILEQKTNIRAMTTKQIAQATYTSPSTLIRIAKKMKYKGWNELKDDYLKEEDYLSAHFSDIDANYPFQKNDPIMTIAAKLATVRNEATSDTLSLLTHDDLQKAVQIIYNSDYACVYAVSNNLNIVQEFKHNMSRIRKRVDICSQEGEIVFAASLQDKKSCSIIVSYSGETQELCRVARTFKLRGIPFIAITSIGDNTIARLADVTLRITTRERLFSKIATFTTDSAIAFMLDVIYSCVYAIDYDANTALKANMNSIIEKGRFSTSSIINETASVDDYYYDD